MAVGLRRRASLCAPSISRVRVGHADRAQRVQLLVRLRSRSTFGVGEVRVRRHVRARRDRARVDHVAVVPEVRVLAALAREVRARCACCPTGTGDRTRSPRASRPRRSAASRSASGGSSASGRCSNPRGCRRRGPRARAREYGRTSPSTRLRRGFTMSAGTISATPPTSTASVAKHGEEERAALEDAVPRGAPVRLRRPARRSRRRRATANATSMKNGLA